MIPQEPGEPLRPDVLERIPHGAVLCVVGARPNFMKIAPIMEALGTGPAPVPACLLHTGQHYDAGMKEAFFTQLGIPEPDVDLGVGSGSHAVQTAEIMRRFEPVVDALRPGALLVVGDVNSTIACGLVAAKKGVPVIHVEAGLRSFDRAMPEEVNRVLTDQISDLLFTTEASARANLTREGIDPARIHFVGNVMIDTLRRHLERAVPAADTLEGWGAPGLDGARGPHYAVLTLHRPSNVDDSGTLERLVAAVTEISREIPVVFPVHPRTAGALARAGLDRRLGAEPGVRVLPPVGYLEMLGLMAGARMVLTDSGGMQEETTALGIPCITIRENTERPITVEEGTNTVVGTDRERILAVVRDILSTGGKGGRVPQLWDGRAAHRICEVLAAWMTARRGAPAGGL
ncbi:UDP-2,3-diacetamido-2,3-dideoxy-D-glucuronate 2-epimerase [bacterium BMS3Bbin12]|nr:UDP-2,3-diacetamido-2,3-dideoxy-D-glucuronate 2-epimerase [bacterium BMS3Abin12]GBE47724.1 UDP-2,3-diacetamido-2,3-dideoxy-D-glucuronate 2-epimerase [bacterium BMS3Bbin12]GBE49924.1 UDP-2,3-diacetamido-2,3-dideoxy-D-glucuronate 2-epimerase [bacterium BMS3Bbin13]